jgi:hypothetical protein
MLELIYQAIYHFSLYGIWLFALVTPGGGKF